MRVAILHDQRLDPLRVLEREPVSDRSAMSMTHIEYLLSPMDSTKPSIRFARFSKLYSHSWVIRHAPLPVAGIVGSRQAETTREPGDQVGNNVRRSRESMREQDHQRPFGPRFAIENILSFARTVL